MKVLPIPSTQVSSLVIIQWSLKRVDMRSFIYSFAHSTVPPAIVLNLWNAGVSPEPRPGHHGAKSAKTIDNKHNMATVMSAVSSMSPQTFPGSTTWGLPSPWHHWRSAAM